MTQSRQLRCLKSAYPGLDAPQQNEVGNAHPAHQPSHLVESDASSLWAKLNTAKTHQYAGRL
jgi:hypothetical protein